MAYYAGDEENQSAQQPGGGSVSTSQPGLISGSGGQATPNAPAEKAAGGTPSGAKPSPFVGINEYLKANQPQSAKLGNTVGGYVEGKVNNANQHLQGAQSGFAGDVDQNTVKYDEDLANQVKANPMALTADANKVKQVQHMNEGYKGPTDFQTSSQFQAVNPELQKAQQAGTDLGNAAGQKNVLTNYQLDTRGGKVNRGAATLDQGLLGASKEAQANLGGAKTAAKGIDANLQSAIQNSLSKVAQAKQTSADTNKQFNDLFTGQFAQQQQGLENKAAQQRLADRDRINSVIGHASDHTYNLSGEEAANLGIDQNTAQQARALGLNLGDYVQGAGSANITGQNVATADDYARAQALSQLSGMQSSYLTDPSQAGKFSGGGINFNKAGLQGAIAQKQQAQAQAAQQAAAQQAAAQAAAQAARDAAARAAGPKQPELQVGNYANAYSGRGNK